MPKPSDDLSDDQLHQGLATGAYEGRDALVAQEILRRRHEERARTGKYRLGWIGAMAAALLLWLNSNSGHAAIEQSHRPPLQAAHQQGWKDRAPLPATMDR